MALFPSPWWGGVRGGGASVCAVGFDGSKIGILPVTDWEVSAPRVLRPWLTRVQLAVPLP